MFFIEQKEYLDDHWEKFVFRVQRSQGNDSYE